jgi:hypothetical protein
VANIEGAIQEEDHSGRSECRTCYPRHPGLELDSFLQGLLREGLPKLDAAKDTPGH